MKNIGHENGDIPLHCSLCVVVSLSAVYFVSQNGFKVIVRRVVITSSFAWTWPGWGGRIDSWSPISPLFRMTQKCNIVHALEGEEDGAVIRLKVDTLSGTRLDLTIVCYTNPSKELINQTLFVPIWWQGQRKEFPLTALLHCGPFFFFTLLWLIFVCCCCWLLSYAWNDDAVLNRGQAHSTQYFNRTQLLIVIHSLNEWEWFIFVWKCACNPMVQQPITSFAAMPLKVNVHLCLFVCLHVLPVPGYFAVRCRCWLLMAIVSDCLLCCELHSNSIWSNPSFPSIPSFLVSVMVLPCWLLCSGQALAFSLDLTNRWTDGAVAGVYHKLYICK